MHLTDSYENFPRFLLDEAELFADTAEIGRHNDEVVAAGKRFSLAEAAERISAAATRTDELLASRGANELVRWHAGIQVDPATFAGIPGSEAIVHGHDIASAEGRRTRVDRSHAAAVLANVTNLLPHYIDREAAANFSAVLDLRAKGGERRFLSFADGNLDVSTTQRPADVVILADAETFLLIGFQRIGQWGPALTGKVLAWGRKPWLALKLPQLIRPI